MLDIYFTQMTFCVGPSSKNLKLIDLFHNNAFASSFHVAWMISLAALKSGRTWSLLYSPRSAHTRTRTPDLYSFVFVSNRTPYQTIAHCSFVLSGHINPSLAFGRNLLKEVNRKIVILRMSYLSFAYRSLIIFDFSL